MSITTSTLRSNIYRLLDGVLEDGKPLIVERKGHRLKIVCEEAPTRLGRLTKHGCIKGDPESLVHLDWSEEWSDDLS